MQNIFTGRFCYAFSIDDELIAVELIDIELSWVDIEYAANKLLHKHDPVQMHFFPNRQWNRSVYILFWNFIHFRKCLVDQWTILSYYGNWLFRTNFIDENKHYLWNKVNIKLKHNRMRVKWHWNVCWMECVLSYG